MASFSIGVGRQAISGSAGNQVFSASMNGDTPVAAIFWLVKATAADTVAADNYLAFGMTDGALAFCRDTAVEDAAAPSIGRRGFQVPGTATVVNVIQFRRPENTGDVTNRNPQLRFVSFAAEQVTLEVVVAGASGDYHLCYALLGGDDLTAILEDSSTAISVGSSLDFTGLGVPADAAIVCLEQPSSGGATEAPSPAIGFWAATAHSGRVAVAANWRHNDTPQQAELEIRDDCNGSSVFSSHQNAHLEQIATGFRMHDGSLGAGVTGRKVVLALNFGGRMKAWAGLMRTSTALGTAAFEDPHLKAAGAIVLATRRQSANVGAGDVDDEDASSFSLGFWKPGGGHAGAGITRPTNPSLSKNAVTDRLLALLNGSDGSLDGSPTTPAADDAVLAEATQIQQGLEFDYVRTSSDERLVAMLVFGDEQTLVPDPVELPFVVPAVSVRQTQDPDPVELPLEVPAPFIGLLRPDPVELEIIAATPALLLPQPPMPADPPRPPFAEFYCRALPDLLPRGLAWTRDTESVIVRLLCAFGEELQAVRYRGLDVIREADPRQALELLSEWEEWLRTLVDCPELGATEIERRYAVVLRLTSPGGQNRFHYSETAKALGYEIEIEDFEEIDPFQVDVSRIGDALWGDEWQFVVIVHAPVVTPVFFTAGLSTAGEPLSTGGNERLTCELDRIKPAHVLFLYEFDLPYEGYAPWNILGPEPAALPLSLPIGRRFTT